ncbi:hypothetical protein CU015_2598 [Enterococcus faecium]|nr:hypothetical protein [Enterococcus faecium]MBK4881613.1 hypothetical protein [Enterococcus faecium]
MINTAHHFQKKPIVLYTGNVGKNGGFTEACFRKNENGNKYT